jgi:hypothetical protein
MSANEQGLAVLREAVDAYRRAVDDGRGGGEWVQVWGGHIEAMLAEQDRLVAAVMEGNWSKARRIAEGKE